MTFNIGDNVSHVVDHMLGTIVKIRYANVGTPGRPLTVQIYTVRWANYAGTYEHTERTLVPVLPEGDSLEEL